VLVFMTYDVRLPFWADSARGELLVLGGFGAGAAVAAGRGARAVLAAVLLTTAMTLQFMLVGNIATYGQGCGPQFRMAWVLTESVLLIAWPVQVACVVVVSAFLIHALSARIGLRGRIFIIGALLLAFGLAVALMPTHPPAQCLDGG
jgi:hypothetical protein